MHETTYVWVYELPMDIKRVVSYSMQKNILIFEKEFRSESGLI
jgi:hypothetical protein